MIPFVRELGVPTANLISYDSSRTIANVPYIVLERLHGPTLAEVDGASEFRSRTYQSLSEILALLHGVRMAVDAPIRHVTARPAFSPDRLIDRLSEIGNWVATKGSGCRGGLSILRHAAQDRRNRYFCMATSLPRTFL